MNGGNGGGGIARALRHRNYKLFFSGQSVSLMGTWITRIATSWLVYRLTNSALLLGLVGFCGQIPTTLLAPWDGTPGTVEWLRVVAADAETLALELRVQWRDVPRVYRMVCGALRIARAAPPDGTVRGRALRRATRSTTAARAARPSADRR